MNARTFAVTVLAALLAVLALASSAWAECAWVLWESVSNAAWEPKEALDTRAACDAAAKKIITSLATNYPGSTAVGFTSITVQTDKGPMYVSMRCLPDTVDPRGAKASGR
jgi:hypothetical protein